MAGIAGVFMNWTQKQTQDTKNRRTRQGHETEWEHAKM